MRIAIEQCIGNSRCLNEFKTKRSMSFLLSDDKQKIYSIARVHSFKSGAASS
jgi:hypothetical protein